MASAAARAGRRAASAGPRPRTGREHEWEKEVSDDLREREPRRDQSDLPPEAGARSDYGGSSEGGTPVGPGGDAVSRADARVEGAAGGRAAAEGDRSEDAADGGRAED